MTVTVNTVWYCNFGNGTSTGYYAVAQWAASTAIAVGALRRQLATPTVGNERVFICIIAGTTGSTEPSWNVSTAGAKTTDGSVTWVECTGKPAVNSDLTNTPLSSSNRSGSQQIGAIIKNNAATYYFVCTTAGATGASEPSYNATAGSTTTDGSCVWTCIGAVSNFSGWGAPLARLITAFSSALTFAQLGDTIYLSALHQETFTTPNSYGPGASSYPAISVFCVAQACNFPPQSSDLSSGASVGLTGATSNWSVQGPLDLYGLTLTSGDSSHAGSVSLGGWVRASNCTLKLLGTGGSINFGSAGYICYLINTTTYFTNTGTIYINGPCVWRNTPNAVAAGVWSSNLLQSSSAARFLLEGVDLSAFSGTTLLSLTGSAMRDMTFIGCKLPPNIPETAAGWIGTAPFPSAATLNMINCDSGGATYRHERWTSEGSQIVSSLAVRTGGASDGTTPISWKVTPVSLAAVAIDPFECMPIAIWQTVIGSTVTVTLECAALSSAMPTNVAIWLEVAYLGTASSTLFSRASSGLATPLSTPATAPVSTAAWNSAAPARANNTAYTALSSLITISGFTGVFICTTSGTSAASQPAGYASAVDGSVITDGTATFTALRRFQLTLQLSSPTPQAPGYLHAYVRSLYAAANTLYFVDPKITLS